MYRTELTQLLLRYQDLTNLLLLLLWLLIIIIIIIINKLNKSMQISVDGGPNKVIEVPNG